MKINPIYLLQFGSIAVIVIAIIIATICIISVKYYKDKSQGDKYCTILCAALSLIVTVLGILFSNVISNSGSIINVTQSFNGDVVINDNSGTISIDKRTTDLSKEGYQLVNAQIFYENEEYDKAISILQDSSLRDSEYAKLDMGYMYAHGYGVKQDTDKAIEYYNSCTLQQAHKNKLALLIVTNKSGDKNDEINDELSYLISVQDSDIIDYLNSIGINMDCDKIEFDISALYKYQLINTKGYKNPPRDTYFTHYKFIGANFEGDTLMYYYERYDYKDLSIIDRFIITE